MKSCKQSVWQSSTRPPVLKTHTCPVANPGKGPAPLFLDQTEARRDKKKFFGDPPPPPPPLSQGLDPALVTNSWRLSHWYRELPATPMIRRFSRASILSQTVMSCNLTLTILSFGANRLDSYFISPSVNTSVSLAKNHLYSPPILSMKRLWNLAIQRKAFMCGWQAILPRTLKRFKVAPNSWSNLTLKCNANTFVKVDARVEANCRQTISYLQGYSCPKLQLQETE